MSIAKMIDHTLLKPEASADEIKQLCREAQELGTWSVCVNGCRVAQAATLLAGTGIKVCTVVGFPLGAMMPKAKAFETRAAVEAGADEIDMVINIGFVKDGNWEAVESDIRGVVEAASGALVKVILETVLLSEEEIVRACRAVVAAGAQFVKTSTGFSTGGATVAAVRLMRKTVGPSFGVKAAGGIHTRGQAESLIEAGASRIGASSTRALVEES